MCQSCWRRGKDWGNPLSAPSMCICWWSGGEKCSNLLKRQYTTLVRRLINLNENLFVICDKYYLSSKVVYNSPNIFLIPRFVRNGPKISSNSRCWTLEAEGRPTFLELTDEFGRMSRDPGRFLVVPGDKLMRLPSYSPEDESELIQSLSSALCEFLFF